jgi:prepilin-type N-terminal cleavage/methylation domain-containing protein
VREAFTLIEVLVSVVIISVVGLALLDMANKNTKMIGLLSKKKEIPAILSIYGFHGNPDLNNLEKNLYDVVSKSYKIDSSPLKEYLNSKKVLYKEELISRQHILDTQLEKEKQKISSSNEGGFLYTIRVDK